MLLRTALVTATLTVLAACASSTAYAPASGGGFGYSDQAIESNRYRVSYRGRSADDAEAGALRRAAELTLQNGFDYFTVVSRDVMAERSGPQSSVGIGGSTGGWRSGVGIGVSVPISGGGSRDTTIRIEIVMGSGEKPDNPRSYDAQTVLTNLRGDFTGGN